MMEIQSMVMVVVIIVINKSITHAQKSQIQNQYAVIQEVFVCLQNGFVKKPIKIELISVLQ